MLRALPAVLVGAILWSGCGTELYRPLRLAIRGLSARADTLVLKVFPDEELGCGEVDLGSAPGIGAPYEERWNRSDGGDRVLSIPEITAEKITILVYSESIDGVPLQFVCQSITLEQVAEAPDATIPLLLSMRT